MNEFRPADSLHVDGDPRIDAFLTTVRADLGEFFTPDAATERIREMRSHLDEAIAELREAGEVDPVGTALADFGNSDGYRIAARTVGNGILTRLPEREVVKWAALTLGIPILLDLINDASSWLTGSDDKMWGLSVPIAAYCGARMLIASSRARRFLAAQLMSLSLASFAAFWVLGGWTRATSEDGTSWASTRGTAYRRSQGILNEGIPRKEANLFKIEAGLRLFAQAAPPVGLGELRDERGYLTPTVAEPNWRAVWKQDPLASGSLVDGLSFKPVASYTVAREIWQKDGPLLLRLERQNIEGARREAAELAKVAACPWSRSAMAQIEAKLAMCLFFGFYLLLGHGLGVATGALLRRRQGKDGRFA